MCLCSLQPQQLMAALSVLMPHIRVQCTESQHCCPFINGRFVFLQQHSRVCELYKACAQDICLNWALYIVCATMLDGRRRQVQATILAALTVWLHFAGDPSRGTRQFRIPTRFQMSVWHHRGITAVQPPSRIVPRWLHRQFHCG